MRTGRRGRLAGLVLVLAAVIAGVAVGAGEFTTKDYGWGAGIVSTTPANIGGLTAP